MPNLISKVYKELKAVVTKSTGGTTTARYCYSVWLRHLVLAYQHGLSFPHVVAEIGPGDSLGIGLAALLSGAEKYFAFDVIRYASQKRNLKIFDELIELFKRRENIPDEKEFPNVKPFLESYQFPKHILSDEKLSKILAAERVDAIRNALVNINSKNQAIEISYHVPWGDVDVIQTNSVDMIYSQAVMEHVNDLYVAYDVMNKWLKKGGFISHQIDFQCHGTSLKWNGHWGYNDKTWRLIQLMQGRFIPVRMINREPYSTHVKIIKDLGFKIVNDKKIKNTHGIHRNELFGKFKNLSDEDFSTSGVFVQAIKQ